MTKLNDTQRTILAAAGARETRVVLPLPKSLKLNVAKATPIIESMVETGLILERPAIDGEPMWRTDEGIGKLTIVATTEGLRAVGIEPTQKADEPPMSERLGAKKSAAPRSTANPRKAGPKKPAKTVQREIQNSAPRTGTKLALLISALGSKKGATISDLTTATGWQAHSVRGAISGALKKKQGLNIVSTAIDGRGRVYRIAE